jgi:hypothetical protein
MANVDSNSIIDSLRQELASKIQDMIEEIEVLLEEKIQEAVDTIHEEVVNGDHDVIASTRGRELTQAEILLAEQRKIERELGL